MVADRLLGHLGVTEAFASQDFLSTLIDSTFTGRGLLGILRWRIIAELGRSDCRVGELVSLLGQPQNLVSYLLRELRNAELVSARRSSADGRHEYYRADFFRCRELLGDAGRFLHPALSLIPNTLQVANMHKRTPRLLFLCTGNSARSQIAEALVVHRSAGTVEARSAGSDPKPLHPNAVRVVAERGVDRFASNCCWQIYKHLQHRNPSTPTGAHFMSDTEYASIRYIVEDVAASFDFYTTHLGFTGLTNFAPAFADVVKGPLRVLLSGPMSSGARALPDGRQPVAGGWNRIHLIVEDIQSERDRLAGAGIIFRSEIISGPGGSQVVFDDPSGNPIELFQPANRA